MEELTIGDFDPRGEYKEVIEAVKKAGGKGEVKIYRLEVDKTRVEYYVVTTAKRGGLIGVVTQAVES